MANERRNGKEVEVAMMLVVVVVAIVDIVAVVIWRMVNGGRWFHDTDILRASLFADDADGLPKLPLLPPMVRLLIRDDVEKSAQHDDDDDDNDVEVVVRGQWVATESKLRDEAVSLARSRAADTMVQCCDENMKASVHNAQCWAWPSVVNHHIDATWH